MTTAYIGLGSNLRDPPVQLRAALQRLAQSPEVSLAKVSNFYRSAPLGPPNQPDYCNAVCSVETALDANALLAVLQGIETDAGRVRGEHWGPRVLDLDLLWMDGAHENTSQLSLPHPQAHLRAFVLLPFAEIAPHLQLPGLGRIDHLAAAIDATGLVLAE